MNNFIPLLLVGAFGAFLIYQNRPKVRASTAKVSRVLEQLPMPLPGPRKYNQWVQSSLNKIMESNLTIDGIIGPLTTQVIRDFQELSGLYPIDGIVGSQTQTAIEQFLEGL